MRYPYDRYRYGAPRQFMWPIVCSVCLHVAVAAAVAAQWDVKPEVVWISTALMADPVAGEGASAEPTRSDVGDAPAQVDDESVGMGEADETDELEEPEDGEDVVEAPESQPADASLVVAKVKRLPPAPVAAKTKAPDPPQPLPKKAQAPEASLPKPQKVQVAAAAVKVAEPPRPQARFSSAALPKIVRPLPPPEKRVVATAPAPPPRVSPKPVVAAALPPPVPVVAKMTPKPPMQPAAPLAVPNITPKPLAAPAAPVPTVAKVVPKPAMPAAPVKAHVKPVTVAPVAASVAPVPVNRVVMPAPVPVVARSSQGVTTAKSSVSPVPAAAAARPVLPPVSGKAPVRVAALQQEALPVRQTTAVAAVVTHALAHPAPPRVAASAGASTPVASLGVRKGVESAAHVSALGTQAVGSAGTKAPAVSAPQARVADAVAPKVQRQVPPPEPVFDPPVKGDLELLMTGKNVDVGSVKVRVSFCEYPKKLHKRPMSKAERKRMKVLVPKETRTGVRTAQAVIEDAPDGIYEFRGGPGGEGQEVSCTITLHGKSSAPVVKRLGSRRVSSDSYILKVLMPEGAIWDDDTAFNGNIEDGESMTKYNSDTGFIWKEYR